MTNGRSNRRRRLGSFVSLRHPSSHPFLLPPSRLLLDPPASGPWNMAVDEALLEAAAAEGQCTLRFYRWAEPTLSLGYFQACADRRRHPASADCPVVRRPSGGGAISARYRTDLQPRRAGATSAGRQPFADLSSGSPVPDRGVGPVGNRGGGCSPRSTAAAHALNASRHRESVTERTERQPFLCFQRRSPGDVLVGGAKIAGSAQRRCRGAVLQHGSLLLARSHAAPELDGLKELSGRAIVVEELIQAWLERLAGALDIHLAPGRPCGAASPPGRPACRRKVRLPPLGRIFVEPS